MYQPARICGASYKAPQCAQSNSLLVALLSLTGQWCLLRASSMTCPVAIFALVTVFAIQHILFTICDPQLKLYNVIFVDVMSGEEVTWVHEEYFGKE